MWPMSSTQFLKTRVSPEEKRRVHARSAEQFVTESTWLRQLVLHALIDSGAVEAGNERQDRRVADAARGARLYVRLRPEDRLLLHERAEARGMAPATYVSVLIRAHLRKLAPLPKEELLALKRSVSELGGIGRNLNQIARAANQGERVNGPGREEVKAMIRVCQGLRDHVRELLSANLRSWEQGYGE